MGDLVNLRLARKRRARADKEAAAAENRIRFGRTRAERETAEANAAIEASRHAGHRLGAGAGAPRETGPEVASGSKLEAARQGLAGAARATQRPDDEGTGPADGWTEE